MSMIEKILLKEWVLAIAFVAVIISLMSFTYFLFNYTTRGEDGSIGLKSNIEASSTEYSLMAYCYRDHPIVRNSITHSMKDGILTKKEFETIDELCDKADEDNRKREFQKNKNRLKNLLKENKKGVVINGKKPL